MSRYARGTEVTTERSRSEIERVLARYGASDFGYMTGREAASIVFVVNGRGVRIRLPLPPMDPFTRTATGKPRALEAARSEWEAACRQAWRVLLLVVKAKLEAIDSGVATFDSEFLAYFVTKDKTTIGEELAPRLASILAGGPLMLGMDSAS